MNWYEVMEHKRISVEFIAGSGADPVGHWKASTLATLHGSPVVSYAASAENAVINANKMAKRIAAAKQGAPA
jgi:hypothetical protein